MRRLALLAVLLFALLPATGFAQHVPSPWGKDPGNWSVYYVEPGDLPQAMHVLESRGETPVFVVQAMVGEDRDCSGFGCHFDPVAGHSICVDPPAEGCPSTGISQSLLFVVLCKKN
ncbi:MAG TPA: hypothetical protein VHC97_06740 [Thermoanaerobaculia bacterium]|jgi:hypothetical protein|nr:hypothetical protein [Thermoanaerobaculia bacterium]